jgi:glycosyltransferase involved in cell wall biosynthesis
MATAVRIAYSAVTQRVYNVIVASPREGLFVAAICRVIGLPVRIVIWPFNISGAYRQPLKAVASFAYRFVRWIIVYSEHESEMYRKLFRLPADRFVFKYIDAPYAEDESYRVLFQERQKDGYIVVPGYSGRDFLTVSRVAAALDYTFVYLTYPQAIRNITIPDNVRVISGISEEEFCRYIARAQICVVPLRNDIIANGHIAIAQAMVFGTPLIATLLPGTRDYLKHGHNCLTAYPSRTDSLRRAIVRLMENQDLRKQLVQNARVFAQHRFSLASSTALLGSLFVNEETSISKRTEVRV